MKLVLVHDWIKDLSGAERVLFELHRIFPDAPIYTLFYDKSFVKKWLPSADIHASFLQKIPFITHLYPKLGWLMPTAIESFDLSAYDRVLSSSAVFSKGLVLKPSTKHICYCYSPTRFLWDRNRIDQFTIYNLHWPQEIFKHFLRIWDRSAADRVDQFVAISETVQQRIQKYYRRESIVIYPPVSLMYYGTSIMGNGLKSENLNTYPLIHTPGFYLIVSRLYPHKNIAVAIRAFNKLNYPLVIIGDGPERKHLQKMASKNVTFLGSLSDEATAQYYAACKAFIMPQEEDFGITAVEAMMAGKPVIALRKGGATETLVEGVTGEFFDDPIPEGLADAVRRFNENSTKYDQDAIKEHASRFSAEHFEKAIGALVADDRITA